MAQQRDLLYSKSLSPKLQEIVAVIRNPQTSPIDYDKLNRTTEFFIRIAPREHILSPDKQLIAGNNSIQNDALLGTRPGIFLTSPESIYGRSLLEIYSEIGYEAEDIIRRQRNQDMVAIVFRYPDAISLALDVKEGNLPVGWENKVYIPYWENMFSLFYRLAENAVIEQDKKGEFAPEKIFFRSQAEKAFALCYSAGAKERIKRLSYGEIKAIGGADWVYRKLLEDKMSAFEHFRGNGRTQNEISDPDGQKLGLVEFLGPNRKIKDLSEVAVIHLGKLFIQDTYIKDK